MENNFICDKLEDTVAFAAAGTVNSSPICEHLLTMVAFVAAKNIISIVEFGVEYGASTAAFLYALGFKGGSLMSYDIERRYNVDKLFQMQPPNVDFSFLQKNSLDARFSNCDLLFIDSYHEYNHIKKELELHGHKAKYIMFHDVVTYGEVSENTPYGFPNSGKGIRAAIDEFIGDAWEKEYETDKNNGLLIIRRKA